MKWGPVRKSCQVFESSRSGSSDGKINVQCEKLLEWPVSNAKMLKKNVTVSVEHMSANKLNFWLSKLSSFAKWPSKMMSVIPPIRFFFFFFFLLLTVICVRRKARMH